jgi:hypothetical protein
MREIDGILYCNDGDWVESCTALVEHFDGRLEILDWPSLIADPKYQPVLDEPRVVPTPRGLPQTA